MMSKQDQSLIKNIHRGNEFQALRRLADEMISAWYRDLPTGETEFLYMKNGLERDGKIMGIDRFLKRIEEIANQK